MLSGKWDVGGFNYDTSVAKGISFLLSPCRGLEMHCSGCNYKKVPFFVFEVGDSITVCYKMHASAVGQLLKYT